MTVREKLKLSLSDRMMTPGTIEPVMAAFENSNFGKPLLQHMDSPVSGYPDLMMDLALENLRLVALEWIEVNKPKAWYKEFFEKKRFTEPKS